MYLPSSNIPRNHLTLLVFTKKFDKTILEYDGIIHRQKIWYATRSTFCQSICTNNIRPTYSNPQTDRIVIFLRLCYLYLQPVVISTPQMVTNPFKIFKEVLESHQSIQVKHHHWHPSLMCEPVTYTNLEKSAFDILGCHCLFCELSHSW